MKRRSNSAVGELRVTGSRLPESRTQPRDARKQRDAITRRPRFELWEIRDFRLLWSAQAVSEVGSGVSQLAYPLLMLSLTGSAAKAGAIAAVRALPYVLFGLVAGALADRIDRKRLMIACEAVRGLVMLSIPIALWLDHLTPTQLYVTAFLSGVGYVFFSAADAGALPNVVSANNLTPAVAAKQATSSATSVAGPALGGLLFGLSRAMPFLTDAVSYLLSVAALRSVGGRFQSGHGQRSLAGLRRDVLDGLSWLWTHPVLRRVGVAAAALQLAISGVSLIVIISAHDNHAGASTTGLLLAGASVGGVAGATIARPIKRRLGFGKTLVAVMWAEAVLWGLLAASPNLALTGVILVAFAATMPIFGVTTLSYRLAITPDHLRSRVGTAFGLMLWTAAPAGAAIAGLLLDHFSPSTTSLYFGGWVLLVASVCTASPVIRHLEPAVSTSSAPA